MDPPSRGILKQMLTGFATQYHPIVPAIPSEFRRHRHTPRPMRHQVFVTDQPPQAPPDSRQIPQPSQPMRLHVAKGEPVFRILPDSALQRLEVIDKTLFRSLLEPLGCLPDGANWIALSAQIDPVRPARTRIQRQLHAGNLRPNDAVAAPIHSDRTLEDDIRTTAHQFTQPLMLGPRATPVIVNDIEMILSPNPV